MVGRKLGRDGLAQCRQGQPAGQQVEQHDVVHRFPVGFVDQVPQPLYLPPAQHTRCVKAAQAERCLGRAIQREHAGHDERQRIAEARMPQFGIEPGISPGGGNLAEVRHCGPNGAGRGQGVGDDGAALFDLRQVRHQGRAFGVKQVLPSGVAEQHGLRKVVPPAESVRRFAFQQQNAQFGRGRIGGEAIEPARQFRSALPGIVDDQQHRARPDQIAIGDGFNVGCGQEPGEPTALRAAVGIDLTAKLHRQPRLACPGLADQRMHRHIGGIVNPATQFGH